MSENFNHGKIIPIDIRSEMEKDFLEYAMSVIVARALPDIKDGLKPVQRRIIYAMNNLNITPDKPHKKSARIVGEVIGKYHPHGDSSVYEAMVRMAQDFSYRYPLIDGHGNFGSIDGDDAAAMRYTEARLSKISSWLIKDIDMDTVKFVDNYDASEIEPSYLPGYFPNLLINGATGIAVGMATNIPPHNLSEVISAINMYIDDQNISIDDLLLHIKGPDFPTYAQMTNGKSMLDAYKTGKGNIVIRATMNINIDSKKPKIIISDIPYQTKKVNIIERIAELAKNKVIEDITSIRDESNYEGIRIVIELKRDANAQMILKKLYKLTSLQINFSINLLTLCNGVPKIMNLKEIIKYFFNYQIQIIILKSIFEKNKIEKRLHILKALIVALDNIDKIVSIIRNSKNTEEARNSLSSNFDFDNEQIQAILDMRLQRLVGLEREKIQQDVNKNELRLKELIELIESDQKQKELLKLQLEELNKKFGDERRTQIIKENLTEIDDEELISNDKMMITISNDGYIRRLNPQEFKLQKRGGRGIKINDSDDDKINLATVGKMRDNILFFSNIGKVYRMKAYEINEFKRTSRGLPLVNYIQISKDEYISSVISIKQNTKFKYFTFVTKQGIIKRTEIKEFESINNGGKVSIKLKNEDTLINVIPTIGNSTILIATALGKIVRIKEEDISVISRSSFGVKGISMDKNDYVVSACSDFNNKLIATISLFGNAKITDIEEYKIISRSSKGVKVMNINEKSGEFKSLLAVRDTDTFIIITSSGNIIKIGVNEMPHLGKNAKGSKIIKLNDEEYISAITLEWQKGEIN